VYSVAAPNFRLPVHPPNADWGEWIHLAANGDQTALARLYDSTSRVVFGLILRILQDRAIAEDVLLDVYLHVWRKGATYSMNKGTPLGWLLTIARSRAIDALRSRTTRASLQQDPLETTDVIADPSPDPERNSAISQRRVFVQRCLQDLPPDQREVIELAFFSGLSQQEIANSLGQPLGTIKTRVRLGMIRLRKSLLRYQEEL